MRKSCMCDTMHESVESGVATTAAGVLLPSFLQGNLPISFQWGAIDVSRLSTSIEKVGVKSLGLIRLS